ncbi:hypothetical protein ACFLSJ_04405 [Verrucomicrobiota bacterium]
MKTRQGGARDAGRDGLPQVMPNGDPVPVVLWGAEQESGVTRGKRAGATT